MKDQHMTEVMTEQEARDLLGRAVGGVPAPEGPVSGAVFARAARLRWRRRALVTGAAAAVAVGAVLGTGVLPGGHGGTKADVAASPSSTATGLVGSESSFRKLLPAGVGKVHEVSLAELIKNVKITERPKQLGPFDGEYAITRDGGTGYVTVHVGRPGEHGTDPTKPPLDMCAQKHMYPPVVDCTHEKLKDGAILTIYEMTFDNTKLGGHPDWSRDMSAQIWFKDGSSLGVRNVIYRDPTMPAPLKTLPLTRAQLHDLVLRPELLP